jgi:hypothetical protein
MGLIARSVAQPADPREGSSGSASVPPQDPIDDLREKYEKVPIKPSDSSRFAKSPHGRVPTIDSFCELIQNPDCSVQNNAIVSLMDIVLENPQFVSRNLRVIVFVLMSAVSSPCSGLAENAPTCLREIASEFWEGITPFFETM